MAKGTIRGSFGRDAWGRAEIRWSSKVNTTGNYSDVTAELWFVNTTGTRMWNQYSSGYNRAPRMTISINGNDETRNVTFSVPGGQSRRIWSRTVRVNHNNDGSKSINIRAGGTVNISGIGSININGTARLDNIARQSDLNSVSVSSQLYPNASSIALNLSVDKKYHSHRHTITLLDGTTVIQSWSNQDTPRQLMLTSTAVNEMINSITSDVSKTFRVRMRTYSGNDKVGTDVFKNVKVTVSDRTGPTISQVSVSVSGSGYDKQLDLYVEGISFVDVSFTSSWGQGANEGKRHIRIRELNRTFGTASDSRYSGTSPLLTQSGTLTIECVIENSRGQKQTETRQITVVPYHPPTIKSFTGERVSSQSATVEVVQEVDWTSLNGRNRCSATWKVNDLVKLNKPALAYSNRRSTERLTGIDDTKSHIITLELVDSFGRRAKSSLRVSTAKVLMAFKKDESVGFGKIPEKGAIDVSGTVYFDKDNYINSTSKGDFNLVSYQNKDIYLRGNRIILTGDPRYWSGSGASTALVDSGENSNGYYIKYYDGTMICWQKEFDLGSLDANGLDTYESPKYTNSKTWTFPIAFISEPSVQVTAYVSGTTVVGKFGAIEKDKVTGVQAVKVTSVGNNYKTVQASLFAIGKWK